MPLVTKQLLQFAALSLNSARLTQLMEESRRLERSGLASKYDVFLSHSYSDKEAVTLLYYVLTQNMGLRVYVDWIQNPELDRSEVTTETAAIIRSAMDRSNCLLYTFTVGSVQSKWMPWELGYSDALHGHVALLPLTNGQIQQRFEGQEYLGLYPYVATEIDTAGEENLYLHDPDDWYLGRQITPGIFTKPTRGWDLTNLRP